MSRVHPVLRGAQVCQVHQVPQELWVHKAPQACQGRWVNLVNLEFLEETGSQVKREYLDYQESRALLDLQVSLALEGSRETAALLGRLWLDPQGLKERGALLA